MNRICEFRQQGWLTMGSSNGPPPLTLSQVDQHLPAFAFEPDAQPEITLPQMGKSQQALR